LKKEYSVVECCRDIVGIDNILYEITIANPMNEIKLLSGDMNFDIIIIMTASQITSFVRILVNVVRKPI
jgi:hypothetical protein